MSTLDADDLVAIRGVVDTAIRDSDLARSAQIYDSRINLVLGKSTQGGRTLGVYQNGQPDGTLVGQTIIIPSKSVEVAEGMFAVYPFQFATVVSNTTGEIVVDRDLRNVALLPTVFDGIIVPGLVATQTADALLDRAGAIGGVLTPRQALEVTTAGVASKTSGMDTTSPKIRNLADTGDLVVGTTDGNGNRTAVTITP